MSHIHAHKMCILSDGCALYTYTSCRDNVDMRKRKRQVLEEDEEVSDDECAKIKGDFNMLPGEMALPEDTTGA